MLLSSAYTKSRTFQFLMQHCHQGKWGCTRSCEGAQAGELTPTDQRNIYHGMHHAQLIKLRVVGQGVVAAPQGLAGHQSAGAEQLHHVSLVLYLFSSLLLYPLPFLLY